MSPLPGHTGIDEGPGFRKETGASSSAWETFFSFERRLRQAFSETASESLAVSPLILTVGVSTARRTTSTVP